MLQVLFMGTGEFAVPVLNGLLDDKSVEVVGVVTQPDKPVGRSQEVEGAPVARFLGEQQRDFTIFKPAKLRDETEEILDRTRPDIVIVAAYGQMVPDVMLESPKYKAINIHGSLLPELRGAVPVQVAILQGLGETGVTIQQMVAELDAGPVIASVRLPIAEGETTGTLMQKLALAGRDLLLEILPKWTSGQITPSEQNSSKATYCYQSDIAKDKAEIHFNTPIVMAERMVRAFNPWPIAWFVYKSKRVKIYTSRIASGMKPEANDIRVSRGDKRLFLHLAEGVLELEEIQLEGKDKRFASDYLFLAE